ncbi:ATP-dependent DNA helicase RecG [bacterium]|nr:MAG: ATP-dependent DNA helicase RecG [bacterium]
MIHDLQTDVKFLPRIGPKRSEALYEVGIFTLWDLLNYFPRRYLDRSHVLPIKDLKLHEAATVVGRVENFSLIKNRKGWGSRFRLILEDDTGHINLVWFQGAQYYENAFERGNILAVYGKVEFYNGERQITHPEFDRLEDEEENNFLHTGSIIPVYPSGEALRKKWFDSRGFRRLIKPLLPMTDTLEETLPRPIVERNKLLSIQATYSQIHFPLSMDNLEKAQERIKFEELFYLQLMMAYRKKRITSAQKGIVFSKVGDKTKELISKLPFQLTADQKKVLREIHADMQSPHCMNRLIQGDVGSGKTIVALLAILIAVENGYQTAFMAPTEILAEQHYYVIQEYLWSMNIRVSLLKGGQKKSDREKILSDIQNHQTDIVIGTHAIFQEQVEFKRLGLIVIDEQHRFGVMQRAEIRQKAVAQRIYPDVLVMTATPIPRTLAMAVYGDLDISVIAELPIGRKPIKTVSRKEDARKKIYEFIRTEIKKGRQCYIVYPLIEESEKSDLKAATEAFEYLSKKIFPDLRLGLLHGKMKSPEKQNVMSQFKNHEIYILVSTTVIEVGVNIPNATIMLIEHAERFGLTQLHQLRGRVGRGGEQSYCVLMLAKDGLIEESLARIKVMEETNDGFKIAEEDLKLRGPGEFFGTKQSGLPELKMAHILFDQELMKKARQAAFDLVKNDPQLRSTENAFIRKKFMKEYYDKLGLGEVG